jgi:DNA-binding NtrC family response regulator
LPEGETRVDAEPDVSPERGDLKSLLRAYERRLIEEALEAAEGNQRRAARVLGLLPTTLHEKMKRLGLTGKRADGEESQL